MSAQERQDTLLRRLVAADDAASDVFLTMSTFGRSTLFHDGLPNPDHQIEVGLGDIKSLAVRGLLAITERRAHGDVNFTVTQKGHAYVAQIVQAAPAVTIEAVPPVSVPVEANTPYETGDARVRQLAFDAWIVTGTWPLVPDLQRDAERRREVIDLDEIARRLDHSIGWIEPRDLSLVLRIKGFADLDGARPYLDAFLRVVGLLYQKYLSQEKKARLTDKDLLLEGFDDDLIRRIYSIADREWLLFGGGQGSESGAWSREPSTNIRKFRDVKTVDDYLRVVTGLSGPTSVPVLPEADAPKDAGDSPMHGSDSALLTRIATHPVIAIVVAVAAIVGTVATVIALFR